MAALEAGAWRLLTCGQTKPRQAGTSVARSLTHGSVMNSPGWRSNWLSTACTNTDMPGTHRPHGRTLSRQRPVERGQASEGLNLTLRQVPCWIYGGW
jgi:hypothetical protein